MNNNKNVGVIVEINPDLTYVGPLCPELKKRGFVVILFVLGDKKAKPHYSPFLHPEHLSTIVNDKIVWYHDSGELAEKLKQENVAIVFTKEDVPFESEPELFKDRHYHIYSLVHSVDNLHLRGVVGGVLDKSIVGFEKYGEYLGWNKGSYVALGLPKYDIISSFDREKILKKYDLPDKYILLLTPNNNLLSWFVVYKIIRQIRKAGFKVVLKGKKPKCHKFIYHLFAKKYFLSDLSFYPFITHELIFASSGVVGFDTTAVEEILMCEKLLVNFSIKPYRDKAAREGNFKQFVPMWNAQNVLDLNIMDYKKFGMFKKLPEFMSHFAKTGIDYVKVQQEVFSVPGGAAKRVVDWLEQNVLKD